MQGIPSGVRRLVQLLSKSTWSLLIMRSCTLHRIHQRLITTLKSKIGLSLVRLIIDFGGLFSDLAVARKVFILQGCWPHPFPLPQSYLYGSAFEPVEA